MDEKTFEDYVAEISGPMVAELRNHQGKGGPGAWVDGDPTEWLTEAQQQLLLLGETIEGGAPDEVVKRAAHVCNYIMMTMQAELAAR